MKKYSIRIILSCVIMIFSINASAQKYEQPVLISSAGQSADVKLVQMLSQRQKLNSKTVLMATAADLQGVKTLLIVPGFSSKGLGAAGVSQQQEMDRVKALVNAANSMKIPIIMVHVGGNARRQGQSDAFNKLIAENSKYMIVVRQGDEDGFFSDISRNKGLPLVLVDKISETETPIANLFN
ncbi:MAG: hypothetical protein IH591_03925 [Bacteroidales bacterium]|nr:hypothetical protein [Bacteroidales bacterium]